MLQSNHQSPASEYNENPAFLLHLQHGWSKKSSGNSPVKLAAEQVLEHIESRIAPHSEWPLFCSGRMIPMLEPWLGSFLSQLARPTQYKADVPDNIQLCHIKESEKREQVRLQLATDDEVLAQQAVGHSSALWVCRKPQESENIFLF